jgi:hypothetical protein
MVKIKCRSSSSGSTWHLWYLYQPALHCTYSCYRVGCSVLRLAEHALCALPFGSSVTRSEQAATLQKTVGKKVCSRKDATGKVAARCFDAYGPQQRELHAALSCRPAACSSRRSRTEAPPHWPEPQPAHAHDSYSFGPFSARQGVQPGRWRLRLPDTVASWSMSCESSP